MRQPWRWGWGLMLFGVVNMGGCDKPIPEHEPENEGIEHAAPDAAQEVRLTVAQQEAIGLTTVRTVEKAVRLEMESFGRVIPRLQGRVQIASPVAGRVSLQSGERLPVLGAVVRKGQVLVEIEQTYTAAEQVQLGVGEEGAGGSAQEAKAALEAAAADIGASS